MQNLSHRLLSEKLHELLIQEIDIEDSQINTFLDNVTLNIILKALPKDKRIEFYRLVSLEDFKNAKKLLDEEIPDLNEKVLIKVRHYVKKIL